MTTRTRRATALSRLGLALAGVAVVALAAAGGWWFGSRDTAAGVEAAATTTTRTVAASLGTLQKTVSATGTLTPAVHEDVSFAVSGTVTSVAVAAGDTVAEGQTLATVDPLELEAALLSARSNLASATASLADAEEADDGSDAAEAKVASASAQVDLAAARVEDAAASLADATLVAPVAGLLTTVDLAVGDVVQGASSASGAAQASGGATSTASFVIIGTDSWVVETTVDESDVALIAVGDQAELTVDGVTDTVFGTVSEVGLLSTSTSGVAAYPVTIAVTGSVDDLHDGVSVEASIVYERRTDVLTVPAAALRTVDGQTVVTVVDDSGAESETTVTTGETSGSSTEIVSGLAEGDIVQVTVVTAQSGGSRSGTTTDDVQPPGGLDPSQLGGGAGPGAPGQAPNG